VPRLRAELVSQDAFREDFRPCATEVTKEFGAGANVNETKDGRQWYALQLRSRCEKLVALHLRDKGYEQHLPLYRSRRRWSDRVKVIELPLFPGYIFCKFDVEKRLPILVIPGVISIVGCGRMPLPIPEAEITAVQRIVNSHMPCGPWPALGVGQRVRVRYGPLQGLEGVVVEARNTYKLILSITLLSRSVAVTIDRNDIVPTGGSSRK